MNTRNIDTVTDKLGNKKNIEQDYILGSVIGQGANGLVRLCMCKASGVKYACKTMSKGDKTVYQEVEIMRHLSGHPGIVNLEAVYEDFYSFHLVMELCSGGDLLDHMNKMDGPYSEYLSANILKQLISVIKYCHQKGVVHRDIKPDNILLTSSGKMKLADFGLAVKFSKGQRLTGLVGSLPCLAPEVLLGDYSDKADIWSVGVILHGLLVGTYPFHGKTDEAILEAIMKKKLDFHSGVWESISGPAQDLMNRMLTRDVSARITVDEILSHPWILFYTDHIYMERTLKMLYQYRSWKSRSSCIPPTQCCCQGGVREL
ncbi:hypothetical protein NE237_020520 [Protea cynaroides]|uniref:Protein kinase domain-containing protein n=1 Tax=Protea cynaroides TaxID=273540 RepID=A0A9Q0H9J1_9MAGN|nr:hypothetical protein NE237_020520 [Protea cynaroides]